MISVCTETGLAERPVRLIVWPVKICKFVSFGHPVWVCLLKLYSAFPHFLAGIKRSSSEPDDLAHNNPTTQGLRQKDGEFKASLDS
jgi:hypothetical protein